ncbi:MAG: hypothetical protein JWN76_104 [Chitinophagaceae bacterium]|nr:hypothetical protein [Chitinophagaceae bacterium]
MNKLLKSLASLLMFCLSGITVFAQDATSNDVMRSNGKIYVVVAVVVVIMLGLFIYVFNLDRKISKIEKNKR